MTELEFSFKTELNFSSPVTEHVFELHCLPVQDEAQQLLSYGIKLVPSAGYELRMDGFGSWLVCGSCRQPHTCFNYASHGFVRVDNSHRRKLDMAVDLNPVLRYNTELTQPDEAIKSLWQNLPLGGENLHRQAEILNMAASEALNYRQGVTTTATTASQALAAGQGVCQDYAHLLLSMARLSGFGARYCMGLIPGEGATHAWVEFALPEGWVGFDPTHGRKADESYLRFATGRDAADCYAEKGVFRGGAAQVMQVDMLLKKRL